MIDMKRLKLLDTFYGCIPQYSGNFFNGWKVKETTVVKVNEKSVLVTFDKYTKEFPQKLLTTKQEENMFAFTEIEVWINILNKAELDLTDYYNRLQQKQCKRVIKKLSKLSPDTNERND